MEEKFGAHKLPAWYIIRKVGARGSYAEIISSFGCMQGNSSNKCATKRTINVWAANESILVC